MSPLIGAVGKVNNTGLGHGHYDPAINVGIYGYRLLFWDDFFYTIYILVNFLKGGESNDKNVKGKTLSKPNIANTFAMNLMALI